MAKAFPVCSSSFSLVLRAVLDVLSCVVVPINSSRDLLRVSVAVFNVFVRWDKLSTSWMNEPRTCCTSFVTVLKSLSGCDISTTFWTRSFSVWLKSLSVCCSPCVVVLSLSVSCDTSVALSLNAFPVVLRVAAVVCIVTATLEISPVLLCKSAVFSLTESPKVLAAVLNSTRVCDNSPVDRDKVFCVFCSS